MCIDFLRDHARTIVRSNILHNPGTGTVRAMLPSATLTGIVIRLLLHYKNCVPLPFLTKKDLTFGTDEGCK